MKSEFIDDIIQDLNDIVLYYDNYYVFADFAKNKQMIFDVRTLNINNYDAHYTGILNLMKDTIETEYMTDYMITLKFDEDKYCKMSIPDLWMNLIMWYIIVKTNRVIKPKYIFFEDCITKKNIKEYIDNYLIDEYTTSIDIIDLNNIIDDCLHKLLDINEFSMFLANTINLEDFVILMNEDPRFNECIHANIGKDVPLDEIKNVGMDYTMEAVERIKQSKHGLASFFRAQEGINTKQFKEFGINIGTKPDGMGGIFPTVVNTNFLIGGVNDLLSYHIESHSGRLAQIIVEDNVSDSGYFARLLGINNIDSFNHEDPNYDCGTRNFVPVTITRKNIRLYNSRFYRMTPNGMEYLLKETDTHLFDKTIFLRSPMTCRSHVEGHGICYKCYGHLAYIVRLINAGKIAAELMSSELTQKMLSAKHLLEAAVRALIWSTGFVDYFIVDWNNLKLKPDVDFTNCKLVIAANTIWIDSEEEDEMSGEMREYIPNFHIQLSDGNRIQIKTADCNDLFLTADLNNSIREYGIPGDNHEILIDLDKLKGLPLFSVDNINNDLNDTLNKIRKTINHKDTTEGFNMQQILETLLHNLGEGGMHLSSVHAETIISNQIRSTDFILDRPDWSVPNQKYRILALKTALTNHPSISVTMAFEGIKAALYNPLTFKKNKPSFLDLFFVVKPQEYLSDKTKVTKTTFGDKDSTGKTIFMKRDKLE